MEVLIGAAAGAVVAALCAFFYKRGVKDGMKLKKTCGAAGEDLGEAQNELMKKYELIMSYDPYGASEKQQAFWGGYGERV